MIGQTLSHYRIVERIGAGGMGVVYRAHDEQLHRDVALKVLSEGLLADEEARNRFRKEALALAKLNHPNIETVYEFGSEEGVDFLAMELIHGETLSGKLAGGSLSNRETARLGVQLAEGLSAAHEQGVIHRDLKPGNLMLTPDGRLKILDFGLAARLFQPGGEADVSRTISETSAVSGTLPYMSPEQLKGLPPEARSDIFTAGTVLYEMAAGQRPFPQSQSAELIGAILHQNPLPANLVNHRVAPELAAVIHKCLEKEPQTRYQSARELLAALEGASSGSMPAATDAKPRGRFVLTVASVLGVVLLAGIVFASDFRGWRDRLLHRSNVGNTASGTRTGPIKVRRSVAVLGFKNLSGRTEEAWLSTAFSEMLTTELAAGERLRTVPGENVARVKIDLSLADEDSYAPDTLARLRKNLGSDYVVFGSYFALGEKTGSQVRLDVRLQDTTAGDTMASVSETGTEAGLLDLISRTGAQLREKLGIGGMTTAEVEGVRASLPSNPEAARLYLEGLAKLRVFDALAARDSLQKSVARDPDHALIHSALAAAWTALGYDTKAREAARRGFDLSASLTRESRLAVEGRYRETTHEWEKAVEIYTTLFSFFPDNLEYGLRLIAAQTAAGKPKDAFATVAALQKLAPPASDDPRIDLAEASVAEVTTDFKREQAAAERAAEKGSTQGARLVVARARLLDAGALWSLGDPTRGLAAAEEAKRIYAAAGDRAGVASALNSIATVLTNQGDRPAAKKIYEETLTICRQLGNMRGVANAMNNLATVRYEQGDLFGAKKMYEESLETYHEIGEKRGSIRAMFNIANVLTYQGDLAGAKKMYEETVPLRREMGDRSGLGLSLVNIADVLTKQGELASAKKTDQDAVAIFREIGNKRGLGYALFNWGEILAAEGNLEEARKAYEEALTIREQIGEKSSAEDSHLSLALLSIEQGRAADAESPARQAAAEFQKEKEADSQAYAQAILARSLLAQGKPSEARKEIDVGVPLAAKSQNRDLRMKFAIADSRVRAVAGKPAEAEKNLEATIAEATKYGFTANQLEARLVIGEIEMKSGKTAPGRTRLAALEKDASAKGFLLIAHDAHVAANHGLH